MKRLYFCLLTSFTLIFSSASSLAQEQVPLRSDWLANDYKSVELISLLASPAPLTPQRIRDILGLEDDGDDEISVSVPAPSILQEATGTPRFMSKASSLRALSVFTR